MYKLLIVLSLIAGLAISVLLMRLRKVPGQSVLLSLMLISMAGIYGALGVTLILSHGTAFGLNGSGGALGLMAGLLVFCLISPGYSAACQEAYLTALPLMYGIGKIGCSFAGCCFGLPYTGPFSVMNHEGVGRIPVQPLEAAVFILLFTVDLYNVLKGRFKPLQGAASFAVLKLALDFLRDSHSQDFITANQIICIIMIAIAVLQYFKFKNPVG